MVFTQLLVNSLIIGSIYALVACGFSLIYTTNKFMHLGHGISVVISSYLLFWFFKMLGVPFVLSILFVLIIAGLFGYLIHKLIFTPLKNRKASNVILLIASIGILILFQNIIQILFGSGVKTVDFFSISNSLNILDATITHLQVTIILISILILILLYLFMNKTKIGRNLRAVSDNEELSEVMGINASKIKTFAFLLGSTIAGVAGILIGFEQSLDPTMGTMLIVKGFTGAIIGGVTSVPASILGSYILGFAENFGIWFLPSEYKEAITFTLLFLFLLFRPHGLFGINKGAKK